MRRKLDLEYKQYLTLIDKKYRDKNKETKRKYCQRPDIKVKRQEYYRK